MGKVAILAGGDVGWDFAKAMLAQYPNRIGFIEQHHISVVVENKCTELAVPHFYHTDEDATIRHIANHNVTTVVLAWWPNIVHKLHKLGINVINTHPSYLPWGRGKYPYYWAIVDETPFGVSIHRVNDGVDDGPVLWQRQIKLTPFDNGESARTKSIDAMKELLLSNIDCIAMEVFPRAYPQLLAQSTYHTISEYELPPIKKNEIYDGYTLINDCRARTFRNRDSGRKIEIDGKVYRVHLELVEEPEEK